MSIPGSFLVSANASGTGSIDCIRDAVPVGEAKGFIGSSRFHKCEMTEVVRLTHRVRDNAG